MSAAEEGAPAPPHREWPHRPWPHATRWVVVGMLLFFLVVHAISGFILRADPDEYQMLGVAFATLRGELLYVDVWDNHGPAITWMLAGLLRVFGTESPAVIVPIRGVFVLLSFATFGVFYFLAKEEVFRNRTTALLAVAICVTSVPIAAKAYEIRGDNPMNLLWVISLLLWLRAWRTGSHLTWFLSGLMLGTCFFFSIKTLILGFTFGLMFLAWWGMERRVRLLPVLLFGAGCAVPFALMLLILSLQGQLDAFFADYFGKNLDRERPGLGDGFRRMRRSGKVWMYATFLALGYGAVVFRRANAPRALTFIWIAAFFQIFQFLFLIPTHWLQSLLPAMPLTAILLAWAVQDVLRDGRHFGPRAAAVAMFVFLLILWMDVARIPRRIKDGDFLPNEIRTQQAVLEVIPPDVLVYSGYPLPYLRDHPMRMKSLIAIVRARIESGDESLDVIGALSEHNVPFVIYDERVAQLSARMLSFIADNYVPLKTPTVMAAGKAIPAGETEATIAIRGVYHWRVDADGAGVIVTNLLINGESPDNPVALGEGTHTVSWQGGGLLLLCLEPPQRWAETIKTMPGFDFDEEWVRNRKTLWPKEDSE